METFDNELVARHLATRRERGFVRRHLVPRSTSGGMFLMRLKWQLMSMKRHLCASHRSWRWLSFPVERWLADTLNEGWIRPFRRGPAIRRIAIRSATSNRPPLGSTTSRSIR